MKNILKSFLSIFKSNKIKQDKNPVTTGSSIEGYYLGTMSYTQNHTLYLFLTKNGRVGVWGKPYLNRLMSEAKVGLMTRVTFCGMRQTAKGSFRSYKVEQDKEKTLAKKKSPKNIWNDSRV